MAEAISISVAFAALIVSAITAWLTLFQLGTVKMTQPTVIFFGPDGPVHKQHSPTDAKVFLRTLLYATSKRGRIIESMFVRVRRGETSQIFNIWAYGERSLARGSGLFVGEGGVACNHHFLLPADGTAFHFLPGEYTVEVYASLVGKTSALKLFSTHLTISPQQAKELKEPDVGIYFDWGPDARSYHPHIRHDDAQKVAIAELLKVED